MIKRIAEITLCIYWIAVNLYGLFGLCNINCGITIGNTIDTLLYIVIIIMPGLLFILKSFKAEWYRKWWFYAVCLFLVGYPYIFVTAVKGMLCGCSRDF